MPDVTRLTQLPGFRNLPAVVKGRVYIVDHSLFSRPGPRLVEGVELLHKLVWQQPCDDHAHVAVQGQSQLVGELSALNSRCNHVQQGVTAGPSPAAAACGDKPVLVHAACAGAPVGGGVAAEGVDSGVCCLPQRQAVGPKAGGVNSVAQNGCEPLVLRIECLPGGGISWVPLQL